MGLRCRVAVNMTGSKNKVRISLPFLELGGSGVVSDRKRPRKALQVVVVVKPSRSSLKVYETL